MSTKNKALILFTALALIALPQTTHAIFGTGVFDYFDSALGGVEEMAGPIAQKIVSIFFTYLTGLILLLTSAKLLELASDPSWLTINGDVMVETGWHFFAGLANTLILLILIWIAINYILKADKYPIKQILPRLLLVAFLLNFSLVFIGMLIDISNIIYNTFYLGSENLPSKIIHNLGATGKNVITSMGIWMVALTGLFIVPFIAPFSQLALVSSFATLTLLLPNIMVWFFQIFCFFTIGTVFLVYALLFAARVFIIKILAILAPLALLAAILPETKKYFDKWLKLLIEWTFFGVFFFLFMNIGFYSMETLLPPQVQELQKDPVPLGILDGGKIQQYFFYYLFLSLYLALAAFISKKMMPEFAQTIIDQSTAYGKLAWGKGVVPLGRWAGERLRQYAAGQKSKEEGREKEIKEGKVGVLGQASFKMGKWARRGIETGARARGTTITEESRKDFTTGFGKGKEAVKNIQDPEIVLRLIRKAKWKKIRGEKELAEEAGMTAAAMEKGGKFKEALQKTKLIDKDNIISWAKEANKAGKNGDAEMLALGFLNRLTDDDLTKMGFKYKEGKKDEEKVKYNSLKGKLLAEIRPDNVKYLEDKSWLNKEGKIEENILKHWNGERLGKAAQEHKESFFRDFNKGAKEKNADWWAENNMKAAVYFATNPAQELGYESITGLEDKDEIKEVKEKTAVNQILKNNPVLYEHIEGEKEFEELKRIISKQTEQGKQVSAEIMNRYDSLNKKMGELSNAIKKDPNLQKNLEEYKKRISLSAEKIQKDLSENVVNYALGKTYEEKRREINEEMKSISDRLKTLYPEKERLQNIKERKELQKGQMKDEREIRRTNREIEGINREAQRNKEEIEYISKRIPDLQEKLSEIPLQRKEEAQQKSSQHKRPPTKKK